MTARPFAPLRQGWELIHGGFACNNRCIFCAQGQLRASQVRPDAAQVRRQLEGVVQRATEQARRGIAFVGGEPTLRRGLPRRIAEARRLGIPRVAVQSNGRRLAYRAYAATLARAGARVLEVSLHGAEAGIHEHHTRVPGSFDQTLAGIVAARSVGLEVGVTAVVTRSNFRNLEALVWRVAGLGVDRLHLARAYAAGEALDLLPRVVPRLELAGPRMLEACAVARSLGLGAVTSGLPRCVPGGAPTPGLAPWPCAAGARTAGPLPRPCRRCVCVGICPGVEPPYLERYGDSELKARSGCPGGAEPAGWSFVGLGPTEAGRG